MTYESYLCFFCLLAFFHPTCLSHPGLFSPPPPHLESLESHPLLKALWEVWSHAQCRVGLNQVGNRGSLQTFIFLGGRLALWAGRAAELTALVPPSQPGIKAWEHTAPGAVTAGTRVSAGVLPPWKGARPLWQPCLPFEMKMPGERNQPVAPVPHLLTVSPQPLSSRSLGPSRRRQRGGSHPRATHPGPCQSSPGLVTGRWRIPGVLGKGSQLPSRQMTPPPPPPPFTSPPNSLLA